MEGLTQCLCKVQEPVRHSEEKCAGLAEAAITHMLKRLLEFTLVRPVEVVVLVAAVGLRLAVVALGIAPLGWRLMGVSHSGGSVGRRKRFPSDLGLGSCIS